MTRKDYERIARAVRKSRPADGTLLGAPEMMLWSHIVCDIAEELQSDNANFNKNTFYKACVMRKIV